MLSRWHCRDREGMLMCFLLSDRFMNTMVLNGAGSMRVLLDCKQCDTSFRWIEGEAPSEYAGEPWSFTDNVKRVLMRGLSWYQLKGQRGYFNFSRDGSGLNLQNKITSLMFIYWPASHGWTGLCELVCVSAKLCVVVSLGAFTEYFDKRKPEATLTTEWSCGQSTPFKRWRPFWPHPVTCWIGDTLAGTWCGRCQRSKIDWEETWDLSGNA